MNEHLHLKNYVSNQQINVIRKVFLAFPYAFVKTKHCKNKKPLLQIGREKFTEDKAKLSLFLFFNQLKNVQNITKNLTN